MLAASWIGTLPGWLTVGAVLAGLILVWRGGGGTALDTLQTANQVLEKRVHELAKQQEEDRTTIAELRGRTDISAALVPLMAWTNHHEDRAQERHEGTLRVLDLIAERLGPENHET